ncbi:YciK family oxidoreductase [Solemya pervernicosa gill symbiont]|uniref:YciK family oxidoreductase n=2 Tax=Gammaproteobacteria incertae sedis TaxID=118884 RepID=A0A1T2L6R3_9GAMM|nr:YciK family oxidoreductase [Candidatus Reidiella endopervernicosa]OOZ40626.1 YciK family oxidoreductase [Solemya pervernicosa gill symbiont]QKQ26628.1 YciK family oxidoreductase [Candidatus Reidiella endopervernicosa]
MQDYSPAADLLKERVILITGAGDGIGRAAARSFAAHGATVVLLGRTTHKLEKVYDEIVDAGHPQPAIYPMNLEGAVIKDYDDLAKVMDQEFGRLDGLLHNAASLARLCPLDQYDPEGWYKVMQVNLNAAFLLTQACLPLLNKAEDGRILFTSDQITQEVKAYWGAYGVSKFAINGMMQMLAEELSNTNIRTNAIVPGPVRTSMRAWAYPGEDPNSLPTPDTIMASYLYLMGADSKESNGEIINAQ